MSFINQRWDEAFLLLNTCGGFVGSAREGSDSSSACEDMLVRAALIPNLVHLASEIAPSTATSFFYQGEPLV